MENQLCIVGCDARVKVYFCGYDVQRSLVLDLRQKQDFAGANENCFLAGVCPLWRELTCGSTDLMVVKNIQGWRSRFCSNPCLLSCCFLSVTRTQAVAGWWWPETPAGLRCTSSRQKRFRQWGEFWSLICVRSHYSSSLSFSFCLVILVFACFILFFLDRISLCSFGFYYCFCSVRAYSSVLRGLTYFGYYWRCVLCMSSKLSPCFVYVIRVTFEPVWDCTLPSSLVLIVTK